MNFEIKKIIIEGFKNYLKPTEFILYNNTLITGDNAEGKSSIGEAVCWAITGCDMSGNEKATTRLVNKHKPKVTQVILNYIQDNIEHTLTRKKRGSNIDIYLDDNKVSSSELAKEIYEEKNIFLSIFNPYFFTSLTPKDSKTLLSKMLKPISSVVIFNELGDFLREKLEANGFRHPQTFLQEKRYEKRENLENIIYQILI